MRHREAGIDLDTAPKRGIRLGPFFLPHQYAAEVENDLGAIGHGGGQPAVQLFRFDQAAFSGVRRRRLDGFLELGIGSHGRSLFITIGGKGCGETDRLFITVLKNIMRAFKDKVLNYINTHILCNINYLPNDSVKMKIDLLIFIYAFEITKLFLPSAEENPKSRESQNKPFSDYECIFSLYKWGTLKYKPGLHTWFTYIIL